MPFTNPPRGDEGSRGDFLFFYGEWLVMKLSSLWLSSASLNNRGGTRNGVDPLLLARSTSTSALPPLRSFSTLPHFGVSNVAREETRANVGGHAHATTRAKESKDTVAIGGGELNVKALGSLDATKVSGSGQSSLSAGLSWISRHGHADGSCGTLIEEESRIVAPESEHWLFILFEITGVLVQLVTNIFPTRQRGFRPDFGRDERDGIFSSVFFTSIEGSDSRHVVYLSSNLRDEDLLFEETICVGQRNLVVDEKTDDGLDPVFVIVTLCDILALGFQGVSTCGEDLGLFTFK
mmetsp:Transcript_21366/g.61272  ORF Transcript_21366/g.61272 Transcript_21366/m.61272 type:complete len:293 (-) Transcript_21366:459-1337(-)